MTAKDEPTPRGDPTEAMAGDPPDSDATGAAEVDLEPGIADDAARIAAALAGELAQQKDRYLRLAAEYDNFRKRTVRERQEAELRGMSLLIKGILDPIDDIGRFAHIDPDTTDAAMLQQGVEMVEKKLLKSLAGHGLELVNPIDQRFDPAVHEAVMTTPAASEDEDQLVDRVFQVGYVFNGQLLRPARVVVKQWHG